MLLEPVVAIRDLPHEPDDVFLLVAGEALIDEAGELVERDRCVDFLLGKGDDLTCLIVSEPEASRESFFDGDTLLVRDFEVRTRNFDQERGGC